MTQLMVLDGHQLKIHGEQPEEHEEPQEQINEYDRDALADMEEEIVMLSQTIEDDRERMHTFIRKVDNEVKDENEEISLLAMEIGKLQQELAQSDDIEDQQAAEEVNEVLEEYDLNEEDNDAPNRHADLEQEEELEVDARVEAMENRRQLKHIFKLITIKTHPDKCGHTSKLNHYQAACVARDRNNLHGMKAIYKKVYGHEYGKSSLFERLEIARRRRDQLRQELSDIRSTGAWSMYQITLEHDFATAVNILRTNLHFQINAMRTMLSELQQRRNWM